MKNRTKDRRGISAVRQGVRPGAGRPAVRQALVTHGGVQACWEREARGTTSGRRASSVHGGYATAWRATSWGDRGIDFKRTASFDCVSAFRSSLLHELMLLKYCVTRGWLRAYSANQPAVVPSIHACLVLRWQLACTTTASGHGVVHSDMRLAVREPPALLHA